jgi:hypothetical protein
MTSPKFVSSEPEPLDQESEHRWLIRVWLIVAAFAVVALVRSRSIGIGFRDPHGEILTSRIALSLVLFVVLMIVDAVRRAGWSFTRTWAVLRGRWPRRRLVLAMAGLLAYHLVYFCYHNLKSWDSFNRVQDGLLLRWDRWLFFGHTPAVLLHDLLGQHVAAYVLLFFYESFSSLVSVTFVAALVFTDRIRDGFVFIAAAMWIWILGVGTYYLIPSLGPFHAAPQDFAGLPHTMIQSTQAKYMAQRANLLAHPHAPGSFAQVSAFASLHVGVTTVIVLMARYYRLRRTSHVLTGYLVVIMVATVYLGWHFAVDDLAGLAIGGFSVMLGARTIYPRGRAFSQPTS